MSLQRNWWDGYLTAALGGLTGAVALLNLGGYLGIVYAKKFMPNAELEGVIPPFIGQVSGWWIGEVLGCWVALRLRRHSRANKTATMLAILTPFGIFFWLLFHIVFLNWIRGGIDDLEFAQLNNKLRPITVCFIAIALAGIARFLTKPLPPTHREN
ncbi:hypothetical protein H6G96_20065 [Nostoc sp. FACHB-892]|uniref:hypothetical protein n=1 Tax=Nostoc sp. FACHB-892 TaxID=2692843 RepID=UPI0016827DA9|nr:hypothetical protein [Nostoc sp. FACHB-892]MBD2728550.1 hypothetical protein [Nostoc sp. FACHB-892]